MPRPKKQIGWVCDSCIAPGLCISIQKKKYLRTLRDPVPPYHCLYENEETGNGFWRPLYSIDEILEIIKKANKRKIGGI